MYRRTEGVHSLVRYDVHCGSLHMLFRFSVHLSPYSLSVSLIFSFRVCSPCPSFHSRKDTDLCLGLNSFPHPPHPPDLVEAEDHDGTRSVNSFSICLPRSSQPSNARLPPSFALLNYDHKHAVHIPSPPQRLSCCLSSLLAAQLQRQQLRICQWSVWTDHRA